MQNFIIRIVEITPCAHLSLMLRRQVGHFYYPPSSRLVLFCEFDAYKMSSIIQRPAFRIVPIVSMNDKSCHTTFITQFKIP